MRWPPDTFAADWLAATGIAGDVTYLEYRADDTYAAAETVRGVMGPPRNARANDGVSPGTQATWTVQRDTAPTTLSRLVDAAGTPWRIDRVTGADGVWDCETTLTPDPP